jgi:sec-independent protein translocase protein TatA
MLDLPTLSQMPLGLLGMPQGTEIIILLVLAVLLFGTRLPKIARSIGQSIVEFKKGVKGVQEDIETQSGTPESKQQSQPTAKKSDEPRRIIDASGTEIRSDAREEVRETTSSSSSSS